jgi:hypothetical protein
MPTISFRLNGIKGAGYPSLVGVVLDIGVGGVVVVVVDGGVGVVVAVVVAAGAAVADVVTTDPSLVDDEGSPTAVNSLILTLTLTALEALCVALCTAQSETDNTPRVFSSDITLTHPVKAPMKSKIENRRR